MFGIKCGMKPEFQIASAFAAPGTWITSGVKTASDLEKEMPSGVTGIMSFGMCGGLADGVEVGQVFLATSVVCHEGTFHADPAWNARIFEETRAATVFWWSTGDFNTANTLAERLQLWHATGCVVIDDETYSVAVAAKNKGIPFVACRVVSDSTKSPDLPPLVRNALTAAGDVDLEAIFASLAQDPAQLPAAIQIMHEYETCKSELRKVAALIGPTFCTP